MATIVISDLNESKELDQAAMRAVTGGRADSRFMGLPSPYPSAFSHANPMSNQFSWVSLDLGGATD